jgi:hypothetical protein
MVRSSPASVYQRPKGFSRSSCGTPVTKSGPRAPKAPKRVPEAVLEACGYKVGTHVYKAFPDGKSYHGDVTSMGYFDSKHPRKMTFHVVYEDGDEEGLTLRQLAAVAVPPLAVVD